MTEPGELSLMTFSSSHITPTVRLNLLPCPQCHTHSISTLRIMGRWVTRATMTKQASRQQLTQLTLPAAAPCSFRAALISSVRHLRSTLIYIYLVKGLAL